jgi:tetratricopeptide (TPR) repeat protein
VDQAVAGHVFVSYSREDQPYARELAGHLRRVGLAVWIDDDVDYGGRWERVICEQVDTCAALVVIMTPAAENSEWVRNEVARSEAMSKPMLPLLLDGAPFFRLGHLQYEDVRGGGLPGPRFTGQLHALTAAWRGGQPTAGQAHNRLFQLPRDIQDFTGRTSLTRDIEQFLREKRRDNAGVVAIAAVDGFGGVGKTTLALHVAHRLRDEYPDGQLYINLRGTEREALTEFDVLGQFLLDLGTDREKLPGDLEERARRFRTELAGGRFLVVLDNARDESQVRDLLPGNATSATIVTSRSRLPGLEGVNHINLDILEQSEAIALLRATVGANRVDAEADAATELVGLCGYLPLAVRIAGARLAAKPHWRITELVGRLRDERRRLSEFKVGDLEVRASFALSYDELLPAEQAAFRLLGLIKSPDFPAWCVSALMGCEVDLGSEQLERLVDVQLVQATTVGPNGPTRYRFHDLLRHYARETCAAVDSDQARSDALSRLLGGYLDLARAGFSAMRPGDPPEFPEGHQGSWTVPSALVSDMQGNTIEWFSQERAALLTGIRQASDERLGSISWELALAFRPFLNWRGQWSDWESSHRTALQAARDAGDWRGEAMVLRHLGHAYEEQDHWDEALVCFERALDCFRRSDDFVGEGFAMWSKAFALLPKGSLAEAQDLFTQCLAIFREQKIPQWQALALNGLALVYRDKGQFHESSDFLRQSHDILLALEDYHWLARVRRDLGDVLLEQGQLEEALTNFKQARDAFLGFADEQRAAASLRDIGRVYIEMSLLDEADDCLRRALATLKEFANTNQCAITLQCMGRVEYLRGRYEQSASSLEAAFQELRKSHDWRWQIWTCIAMARTRHAMGADDAARQSLDEGLAIAVDLGSELLRQKVTDARISLFG